MQIIRSIAELRKARRGLAGTLSLVPTMGALHEGHLTLVREGRARADQVAATIFVNPLQFGAGEDLGRYPRQEEQDLALLEREGCDLVWLPTPEQLYPAGFATTVTVSGVSERWEGAARPGHFAGVATVVAKLLLAAAPDVALFGEKDFQQLAVIRRMATDLGLPVQIIGVPTVRDADGLALSSRNAYLSADERTRALALPRALGEAERRIAAGEPVDGVLAEAKAAVIASGFESVDYLALVDADRLEPLEQPGGAMRLIAAATIGSTRLIDNMAVSSMPQEPR
ncbi:pantoate--beta-alanine ligase [Sphingomonas sp. BN140010]|uniref:Pantothenate synthetase n=1 Tax=Sphingomonas arvum TaxID=2992113 RepID=A0ABT3JB96_9SPHN|nr:pantoate--beta-alanine ligase [Sphingomonas sp. BN140010]MCW3796306.1 pantoate--beta-alanine ligase [Sphingomonas sp. BN140010]